MKHIIFAGIALFTFTFYLSLLLTRLARGAALRKGLVNKPSANKLHKDPVPLGGGIAICLSTFIPLGIVLLFAWLAFAPEATGENSQCPEWLPLSLAQHLPGILASAHMLGFMILGGLIMMLIGIRDDIKPLPPWRKLAGTVAVAVFLVVAGIRVTVFIGDDMISSIITILWIVGITHVFNLLDNMDGLCASVAGVISTILMIVALQTGQLFVAAFLLVFIAALLGFLKYNFPPARIFMGDGGSLFIGYTLAMITIVFSFFDSEFGLPSGNLNRYYVVLVPILLFAVPLFDTISVILIRIREKRPIYTGDTCHFSHRLLKLGMTTRGSLLTVCLATLCTALPAILLYRSHGTRFAGLTIAAVLVAQTVGIISVIVLLEKAAAKKNGNKDKTQK